MKKRILIVVGIPDFDYSDEKSAVLSYLNTIKTAFEKEGYKVDFAQDSSHNMSPQVGNSKGGWKQKLKNILKKWAWLYHTIAFRNYFSRQDALVQQISIREPYQQIIEFHTVGSTVGKALAAKWKASLSVIFDSPVDEQFYEIHKTKTAYWSRIVNSEKNTLEAADQIMVYSPACENHIRNKYNITAQVNKLACVIHKEKITNSPSSDTFIITFIGSFLSWHKLDLLVNVFEKFHQKYSNSKLQLIGYGVEWNRLKELVGEKKMRDSVEMPGFVSEKELLTYKKECTIAIMPGSNWYGSPLKLFEYAQSAIPFIAPSTKTVSDIFENKIHCLVIDANNEEDSLLEKLNYLYENPLERKEIALRANQYIMDNYGEKIYAKKLVETLLV